MVVTTASSHSKENRQRPSLIPSDTSSGWLTPRLFWWLAADWSFHFTSPRPYRSILRRISVSGLDTHHVDVKGANH